MVDAIQESLVAQPPQDASNPIERSREGDTFVLLTTFVFGHCIKLISICRPVGLANVGNTCYVNSVIQTYFFTAIFRDLLFALRSTSPGTSLPEISSDGGDSTSSVLYLQCTGFHLQTALAAAYFCHVCVVIEEFQKLFGFLTLSRRKYCDPKSFLETLFKLHGQSLQIGIQADVSGLIPNVPADFLPLMSS